jgi:hypothetical protein
MEWMQKIQIEDCLISLAGEVRTDLKRVMFLLH